MTDLATAAKEIEQATSYYEVFGPCEHDDYFALMNHVKHVYHKYAKVLHPDLYADGFDQMTAQVWFVKLGAYLEDAHVAIEAGAYGEPTRIAVVNSRKGVHEIISQIGIDDLATIYRSSTMMLLDPSRPTVTRVALNGNDNDLMQAEVSALKVLRDNPDESSSHPFFPELVDSFAYRQPAQPNRQANVTAAVLDGFYRLDQIREAFRPGLDPLHVGWIWRRLLYALRFAHDKNLIHGAVLPNHVLVHPEKHGVILTNWTYSVQADQFGEVPPIKAIVAAYKGWYPSEVAAKVAPSPATDILMAARCMIDVMGGDAVTGNLPSAIPSQYRAFFKGCLSERQVARPQDAGELLTEFDELLESMGRPYFPRKFRPLTMPVGVA